MPYTVEQQTNALIHANQIRTARAKICNDIRQGKVDISTILRGELDSCLETMAVYFFILYKFGWGTKKTQRMLERMEIPERKQLGKLTPRQRNILACALEH